VFNHVGPQAEEYVDYLKLHWLEFYRIRLGRETYGPIVVAVM
jgi:hypothetical protein